MAGDVSTGALLDREPDATGIAYWRDQMSRGMDPFQVTSLFYQSVESRTSRVEDLYLQILRREPEPGGLDFWSNELFRIDDIRLAVELATSAEYYDLVTQ